MDRGGLRSGGCGAGFAGIRGEGLEELLLAADQGADVVGGQFETVAVGDGVGGAGFDAIAAEDAARVIDIVDAGVALAGGDSLGFGIFGGFDVDAAGGAGGGAEEAAHAFFQAVLVAMQDVDTAVARLEVDRFVRIIFRDGLAPHAAEGDVQSLRQRGEAGADFMKDSGHGQAV